MSQGFLKSHPDSRVYGTLRHALYDILHRLFSRDNAGIYLIAIIYGRIEGCRFPSTCRSGNNIHSRWHVEDLFPEAFQHLGSHSEIFNLIQLGLFGQDAHDNFFPKNGDVEGDSDVDFSSISGRSEQDAAILVPTSFSDIG